jgi:ATP-dependent RNA helicase DDX51/DBP6
VLLKYLGFLTLVMLQVLSNRIVTRLRALIVLPTRDLVTQVRETFEAVGKGRGLKVVYTLLCIISLLTIFARLAPRLANTHLPMNKPYWFPRHILGRFSLSLGAMLTNVFLFRRLLGGSSKVDVLICTPGRLMDHLHGTPNFSLQHLRFLVRVH